MFNTENCVYNIFLLKIIASIPKILEYIVQTEISAILSPVEWVLLGIINLLLTPPSRRRHGKRWRGAATYIRSMHMTDTLHSSFGVFKLVTGKVRRGKKCRCILLSRSFKQNKPGCGGVCL